MAQHSHRYTFADDDAVRVLLSKLVGARSNKVGVGNCFVRLTTRLGTTGTPIKKVFDKAVPVPDSAKDLLATLQKASPVNKSSGN